jgi:cytidine deaminase
MIQAPARADPEIARRLAELSAGTGAAVEADVAEIVQRPPSDPVDGSVITSAVAADLVVRHGLASPWELALLALPVAGTMARPHISGYRVAAVGIEAGTGDLLLGANLEFPGTDLGMTIHAEGFVSLRARRRGRTLDVLAIPRAHPCAHCRQTLIESAGAGGLRLIDPLGYVLALDDLYPWAFGPSALGIAADDPAVVALPGLRLHPGGGAPATGPGAEGVPGDIAGVLEHAGARAHAPYSKAPSAVALRLRDGSVVGAGSVESVAFNPSIEAIQAALVEVAAVGAETGEIVDGWLARTPGGSIDPAPRFRAVLQAVAPGAPAHVVDWAAVEPPARGGDEPHARGGAEPPATA